MAWTSESVPSTGSNWTSETVPSFIGWTPESTPVTSWKRTGHFGWAVTSATETGSITYNISFTITITFDEPVVDFDVTDFNLINCTISSLAGSGKVYTATCSKSYYGQITVAILNKRVTDDKGNKNSIGTPFSIDVQLSIMTSSWTLSGGERTIKLPLISGGNYNFDIDWGDETISTVTAWNQVIDEGGAAMTHTYASAGEKNIEIGGASNYTIVGWQFNNDAALDKDKIQDISDWGPLNISTNNAFYGCSNLDVSATNSPTLGADLSRTFDSASELTGGVANWNVSSTTDMTRMFRNAVKFNQDISSWNVSNVQYLEATFSGASVFNKPIGSWTTSSLERLQSCFNAAPRFNQDISNWNTSSVNNMGGMFQTATDFNQDISSWNVSNVDNMSSMFKQCTAFNQDISGWDISRVENITSLFHTATSFNNGEAPGESSTPLDWDTSGVTANSMGGVFRSATAFNQDISEWDTSNVTSMSSMFFNAEKFNQAIPTSVDKWNVSNVENMSQMFRGADDFNQALSTWDTGAVTTMVGMFRDAEIFNQNIGDWDVTSLTTMASMFQSASAFNNGGSSDINNWRPTSCDSFNSMFNQANVFNQSLSSWTFKTGGGVDCTNMFNGADIFDSALLWGAEVLKIDTMTGMFGFTDEFNQDISGWETDNVTNMVSMFYGAEKFNQSIGSWDTSSVTNMSNMFLVGGSGVNAFNQDISSWTVAQVTNFTAFLQNNTAMSDANWSDFLIRIEDTSSQSSVSLHGGGANATVAGAAARDALEGAPRNWIIVDGDG